ncbi:MAG: LysM peptidoglycan-binding domain-containing protein [Gammaproteobacteria bacterium]|nr:LysM peptidoglycan-binding domain-containing protein [Gammaproteobacteria bacterium]NNC78011.1 LysM peptidoglycan-binding domain-containing protein [Woeseiaceae bacterium]
MYANKDSLKNWLRLTAVATTATLAGCSLNPFGGDDEPRRAAPITSSAPAPSGSSSMNSSGSASSTAYEPQVVRTSDPVPLASGAPNEYVVKVGDTLWDIAGTFLKDPWYWPEIWYVNPEIENPHLIYPGDVLGLVYIDGQPRITNVRASTYRMSPQARITPLTEAINSIPYEAISSFLSTGVVLAKDDLDSLPYLIASRGDHMIASAGNEIYVRGVGGDAPGTRFGIVSVGDPLVDPDDDRVIGYEGIWVGEGTMRRGGDPATVRLNETTREAKNGDRLIPESIDIPLNFFPKPPSSVIDGRIISVVGGVTQIGQYQVVVMNRGARDGLGVGDVLTVFQAGREVRDRIAGGTVRLPDEEAGTIMVFKVYDDIGYGLVMEAQQAIHVLDAVRNPT